MEVGKTLPQDAEEHATVQVTPLFAKSLLTVAVNCWVVPATTVGLDGSMLTVIVETVTVADAAAKVLATEVAVTMTGKSVAGGAGAVYVTAVPLAEDAGETPPQVGTPQETVQATPLLLESPATLAVNCAVPFPGTVGEAGETTTPTEGTTMVAANDFVASVTEVAVSVTVKLVAGRVVGAV